MTGEELTMLTWLTGVLFLAVVIAGGLTVVLAIKRAVGGALTSGALVLMLLAADLQLENLTDPSYWSVLAPLSTVFYVGGGLLIVVGAIVGSVRMKREANDAADERAALINQ